MKRRRVLSALALSAGAATSASAQNAWSDPFAKSWHESFTAHWRDTREYTLAMMEAMPAEHFTSKPDPAQRGFGEQFVHLAQANNNYFQGIGLGDAPKMTANAADKESVRKFLTASFDYTAGVLGRMTGKDMARRDIKLFQRGEVHSATDVCLRAYMHTAHHRGQAVAYLRVKGITPPAWKFEPKA